MIREKKFRAIKKNLKSDSDIVRMKQNRDRERKKRRWKRERQYDRDYKYECVFDEDWMDDWNLVFASRHFDGTCLFLQISKEYLIRGMGR